MISIADLSTLSNLQNVESNTCPSYRYQHVFQLDCSFRKTSFFFVLRLVCRVKGLLTKGKNGTPIVIDFKACIWRIFGWLFIFSGTNDAFVTISLGKEKFQTSVKQKALSELEWQEECELWVITLINNVRIVLQWHFYCFRAIPTQGNTAEIVLTALHQNFIGVDEFLGMVSLPLSNFDVYERPRTK